MILYQDYFDENKMNQPYASGEEQLQEAFSLMDMLLESYLEQKGGMEKQAFSKGLVVTESEIQQYLETPPFFKKTGSAQSSVGIPGQNSGIPYGAES